MLMARFTALWKAAFIAVITGVSLAACGGGGGTNSALPSTNNAPSGTVASNATVPFSSAAGFAGSVTFGNVTAGSGAQISLSFSQAAPPGAPVLQTSRMKLPALQNGPTTSNGTTIYGYLLLQTSSNVNATSFPQISITLPRSDVTSGLNFYLAYFDPANAPNGYQMGMLGPQTTKTNTVAFPPVAQPFTLDANQLYIFVLYSVPIGTVTPSPSPTPTPTVAPSPSATASSTPSGSGPAFNPSVFSVVTTNAQYGPQTWTVQISDGGYSGPWHPVSGNTSVVTVADCSSCTSLNINPLTAGETNITVTDGGGRMGTLPVIVTEVDVTANFPTTLPTAYEWEILPGAGALAGHLPVPKPLPSSNTFKSVLYYFGAPGGQSITAEVVDPTFAALETQTQTPTISLGTVNTITFNF